jgi:hypothetical protein
LATLTERVAQNPDLRAIIATLRAPEQVPAATEADALVLASTPWPATKKPPTRRRG